MNTPPVFDSVRELLSLGDTGDALQVLLTYLEKEGTRPDLLRTLRVVESGYHATRQQEIKGILDFSQAKREYAQVNDALLAVLEDLIRGRSQSAGNPRNKRLPWIIGGGIFMLLCLLVGWWYSQRSTVSQNPDDPFANLECPKFRPEGIKVLVLEFQKLGGNDSKPEFGIQTRIRDLTHQKMDTDVRILPANAFGGETPGTREATTLGKHCQASLVIWGQYDQGKDSIEVDIRYAFTDPVWPPGAALQTFKNVTELKTDHMKISDLDEAVLRLCTALALHENRMDLAEKWLNRIKAPNVRERGWKEVLEKR